MQWPVVVLLAKVLLAPRRGTALICFLDSERYMGIVVKRKMQDDNPAFFFYG
jgi:hypothetical protein